MPRDFQHAVAVELARARLLFPRPTSSLHEGYAVLLEEVDEFWEIVKMKASKRDAEKTYEELVQIAAMAQKCAEDCL
jgi:hypothetical protein